MAGSGRTRIASLVTRIRRCGTLAFAFKNSKNAFAAIELLVVAFAIFVILGIVIRQAQLDVKNKKIAKVKSTLTFAHQGALVVAKKYEFTEFESFLNSPANSGLRDCFKGVAIAGGCNNFAPLQPKLHDDANPALLTDMQKEENASINGGLTLNGTMCTDPNPSQCAIQNITELSFNCTTNACSSANFRVTTRLNTANLNSEDRSLFASIPPLESLIVHDDTKEHTVGRSIASCTSGNGVFGFLPSNGAALCDSDAQVGGMAFDVAAFSAQMLSGSLEIASATAGGGADPTCPAGTSLDKIDNGQLICRTPLLDLECSNGASNYPNCDECPSGEMLVAGVCKGEADCKTWSNSTQISQAVITRSTANATYPLWKYTVAIDGNGPSTAYWTRVYLRVQNNASGSSPGSMLVDKTYYTNANYDDSILSVSYDGSWTIRRHYPKAITVVDSGVLSMPEYFSLGGLHYGAFSVKYYRKYCTEFY